MLQYVVVMTVITLGHWHLKAKVKRPMASEVWWWLRTGHLLELVLWLCWSHDNKSMDESVLQSALNTTCESFLSISKVDHRWKRIHVSKITPTTSIIITRYHHKTWSAYQHITHSLPG